MIRWRDDGYVVSGTEREITVTGRLPKAVTWYAPRRDVAYRDGGVNVYIYTVYTSHCGLFVLFFPFYLVSHSQ